MSLAEMKESAKQLTAAELEELALHLEFLRHATDPAWRAEILRRASEPGSGYSEKDVIELNERLTAEGK